MTLPAHPTCGCEELAPETSLVAKSHRPGRVQLRLKQLPKPAKLEDSSSWIRRNGVVDDAVDGSVGGGRCRGRW